ncbi:MAG TPA: DUF996 domain-containing protein [Candidatus Bathyarchaeota archaeon]|nr:DUF996 domain-containing protein [Candidatus Bathyarchaeota archaeon]
MSIETSRILGGVGALLMFIGVLPYVSFFGVIEVIGLILVMVALYNLSSYYREARIFNNALYGLIAGIVGCLISAGVLIITVLTSLKDFLYEVFPDWNGDWTTLSGLTPNPSNISIENIVPFIAGIFAVLIIFWVFFIIAAFFFKRSFGKLSEKSGIGLFSTAGLLLLIGALLIILFGVGLILMWISALLLAIAFFQLKPQQEQPTTSTSAST